MNANSLYQGVFDSAPDAILVVNKDGVVLEANEAVTELLGYSKDDLVGQSIDALVPKESHADHVGTFFKDPTARPMAKGAIFLVSSKYGSDIACKISLQPISIDGPAVAVILRDARERLKAKVHLDELKQAISRLESTD